MLPIKYFIALIVVTLFVTIFVLFNDRIIPQNTGTQSNSPLVVGDEQMEAVKVGAGELISTATKPVGSRVVSQIDGVSLLKSHCSQCHVTQGLEKFKKSRSEWELTLSKMKSLGVHLSETERVILLNYLAAADKP